MAPFSYPTVTPFELQGDISFKLWETADLLNALYQANHAGLVAGQFGAAYFIPTVGVPLLRITHGLAYRILLQHQGEPALDESRIPV